MQISFLFLFFPILSTRSHLVVKKVAWCLVSLFLLSFWLGVISAVCRCLQVGCSQLSESCTALLCSVESPGKPLTATSGGTRDRCVTFQIHPSLSVGHEGLSRASLVSDQRIFLYRKPKEQKLPPQSRYTLPNTLLTLEMIQTLPSLSQGDTPHKKRPGFFFFFSRDFFVFLISSWYAISDSVSASPAGSAISGPCYIQCQIVRRR